MFTISQAQRMIRGENEHRNRLNSERQADACETRAAFIQQAYGRASIYLQPAGLVCLVSLETISVQPIC